MADKFIEQFHDFRAWLTKVNGCEVDLEEREFCNVFGRCVEHYHKTPVFDRNNNQRLSDKAIDECVVHAMRFLKTQYNEGKRVIGTFMCKNDNRLSWKIIQNLIGQQGGIVAWVTALRMTHVGGDFGEDIARKRTMVAEQENYDIRVMLARGGHDVGTWSNYDGE